MTFNKVIAVKRTFENYVKLCNEYSEKYSKTEVENILNNYNQKRDLGVYPLARIGLAQDEYTDHLLCAICRYRGSTGRSVQRRW